MSDAWTMVAVAGMTVITVVARSFFFLSERPWHLPRWAERGLRYAPVAALAAVVVPEILATNGHLITTWRDARLFGAAAGIAWYAARRGVLGTIAAGMVVYLPLHVGWGW